MKKRFVSVLLAIVLLCSVLPWSCMEVCAATYSGSCGSRLRWSLDTSTGLLTISGSGAMTSVPWINYSNLIKNVSLPNGLTSIAAGAFSDCMNLASVTIPDSVTSIGDSAFAFCGSLKSITIPGSVKSIGRFAFDACWSLENVELMHGVESIGYCSFFRANLKSLVIPNSVETIDYSAFSGNRGLTRVTIGTGVRSIGQYAFGYYFSENPDDETEYKVSGFTIHGELDSVSQSYANSNGFQFEPYVCFVDVPANAYYAEAVRWAVYNNVTSGTDLMHFSPKNLCTREQVISFLYAACGKPAHHQTSNPFSDVKPGKYYYNAVLWAYEKNITRGVGDGKFGVGLNCTREQAITFIWKAIGWTVEGVENPFTDVKPGKYYYDAVLWAYDYGVTRGIGDGKFGVGKTCTRAEIVSFLFYCYLT